MSKAVTFLSIILLHVSSALITPQQCGRFQQVLSPCVPGSIQCPKMTASIYNSEGILPLEHSPPRKICLMVEPTPFTHISGYSNRFKEMLRFLSKAGDKVNILTVDQRTPKQKLPTTLFGFNIEHTHGFTFPLYNHISLSLDLQMKGRAMMKKIRPDLIHVSSPGFMLIPAMIYARLMRIPLLMSYHTHVPMYAEKYLGFMPAHKWVAWALLRWAHTKADLTLCTSPQIRAELLENGIPRVDVWKKGVDSEQFNPKFRDYETRKMMTDGNPDDFLIVSVGRIGAEKRIKDFKPVLERLGPNARFCIVGDGPQLKELKRYFKGTNTVFTGQLLGEDLSKTFASADVSVVPSDTETLGFVVMESMASGVPVVGAAAGGIPDMLKDGKFGYLFKPGDTEEFLKKVEKLRDDPELRLKMGAAARNEAGKWRWEDATSFLRNVQYETAIKNFEQRS